MKQRGTSILILLRTMARNLKNYRFQKTIVLWYLNFGGFQYHTSIV